MNRRGLTLLEVLIVMAIIAIFIAILLPILGTGLGNSSYYSTKTQGVFYCVKTYTIHIYESGSSCRVDLRPANDGPVQTVVCDIDMYLGISPNKANTNFAQFEAGKWYNVNLVGVYSDGFINSIPVVVGVSPTNDPRK
jgi:prepilin-type N-terminal cleavage/methylation domain-containing protein